MHRLHDIQREFCRSLLSGQAAVSCGIRRNGVEPEQRLAIYRNNTEAGLAEALRNVYPVLDKLVGDAFFRALARDFIRAKPPRSPVLSAYGGDLPEFLASYPGLGALPYLPDVARLEWAWHEAYHAADGKSLDPAALARLDSAAYDSLGFELHPSARLLASDFPIARIWQANQKPGDHDTIRLDEGGCRLLVFRPDRQIRMWPLDGADYRFLEALARRQTLVAATAQALAYQSDFDLQSALLRWLAAGLLTGFFIDAQMRQPSASLTKES
ncbi:HvfC/BufC N-terminal domain-containing protein [Methylomonas sp. MgM2]